MARPTNGTTPAPDNMIWVCLACGKTSRTKFGFLADNTRCSQHGWDASCMLNSALCYSDQRDTESYAAEDSVFELNGKTWVIVPAPEMPSSQG